MYTSADALEQSVARVDAPASQPITLSVFASPQGTILSKAFTLRPDGSLEKCAGAQLWKGEVWRTHVKDPRRALRTASIARADLVRYKRRLCGRHSKA